MKKSLILGLFLVVIVGVFYINSVSAAPVCCERSGDSYCVFTDENNCEAGGQNSPFSCSQTEACELVVCITESGECRENMPKAQCLAEGGKISDSINIPQCQIGCCVVDQQCSCDITAAQCRALEDSLNDRYRNERSIKTEFDSTLTSESECRVKHSRDEGCCVSANSCTRTQERSCAGDFNRGMLCSNPQLAGQCDCQPGDSLGCSPDGEDVQFVDSCGNLENLEGISYDGLIHDTAEEIGRLSPEQGNCDYSTGTVCKAIGGSASCEDLNCRAGDEYEKNRYVPTEGKSLAQLYKVTSKELGGKPVRQHGESWCNLVEGAIENIDGNSGPNKADSPGTIHYRFSCIKGEIIPEQCGGLRDEICESDNGTPEAASCKENEYNDCTLCHQRLDGCDQTKCEDTGHCYWDTEGANECLPLYPIGQEFWLDESFQSNTCNSPIQCGDTSFPSKCDANECSRLGDCSQNEGWPWYAGAVTGGAAGAAVGLGSQVGIPFIPDPRGLFGDKAAEGAVAAEVPNAPPIPLPKNSGDGSLPVL